MALLPLAGCVFNADCDAVIERLRRCDPPAATAPDIALRTQCLAPSTPRCATIDVSTSEGCAAFLGCAYGD